RWDFRKFRRVSNEIGTQMKSVGEVMAIGRCFEEAIQKAIRMLDLGRELTDVDDLGRSWRRIKRELQEPTDQRVFYVVKALKSGFTVHEVSRLSGIDPWFLDKLLNILRGETELKQRGICRETVREAEQQVIMVNCNPETVSTDFDVLDKLYFEELTIERIRDIIDKERPRGVVLSVGGQTPNNLAQGLAQHVTILGTSPVSIDTAEDRSKFGLLLDRLGIDQPEWSKLEPLEGAAKFADESGNYGLIRPSDVLSG